MMMYRRARASDAEAISAIWNPIIRDTTITFTNKQADPADISKAIDAAEKSGDAYYVACADDVVQGFARLTEFRSGPGYAHTQEVTIHLAPSARGAGFGRHLMARLEEHARNQQILSLIAAISAENSAAVAFHAAMGFDHVARLPKVGRKFRRYIDLILMQKFL